MQNKTKIYLVKRVREKLGETKREKEKIIIINSFTYFMFALKLVIFGFYYLKRLKRIRICFRK